MPEKHKKINKTENPEKSEDIPHAGGRPPARFYAHRNRPFRTLALLSYGRYSFMHVVAPGQLDITSCFQFSRLTRGRTDKLYQDLAWLRARGYIRDYIPYNSRRGVLVYLVTPPNLDMEMRPNGKN